jgi:acyl dehydratase
MERIENRTFDEIKPGDSASLVRTLTYKDIEVFAIMSGDINPAHVDETFAKSDLFHGIVAHGMWGAALISTVLGTQLPGPGSIYVDQSLHFHRPVGLGDTITVTVRVTKKAEEKHRVILDCYVSNQLGEKVISGTEAGNMLAKQREYLAEAQMAGIVHGARVPIILTSRADGTLARLGSSAIALLLARHKTGATS